ncbi:hypothetical protein J2S40_003282 [Nocardioides luteus]|nr:hypothetical protein [Nocardioides luteus]
MPYVIRDGWTIVAIRLAIHAADGPNQTLGDMRVTSI